MALLDDLPVDWSVDADDEAFDGMYRQHRAALLAFCRSRLGDAGDAEDACQEAFLRAYRALPRFDRAHRMWPWLATIAANVCTDMHRRKRPAPLSAVDGDLGERTVDPEIEAEVRAKVNLVGTAIRDLPEAYRRSVYLADLEGWSYDAIARHERKSVASVRSNLMRGRSAFRTRVQALAEERGMWPLSAVLPLRWRSRLLAWRADRSADLAITATPGGFTAIQAAVAAISLLGAFAPGTMAVAAADQPPRASGSQSVFIDHHGVPTATATPGRPSGNSRPAPPGATTAIDLVGERRSVDSDVTVTDDEPSAWLAVEFDCHSEARDQMCATVDSVRTALP